MSFSQQVWDQLKNTTCDELMACLSRDGWSCDTKGGSMHIYRHPDGRRVSIHYHPKKTYGAKMLKGLLTDTGWSEEDMRRVKLL